MEKLAKPTMVPCWDAGMPRGILFLKVRTQFSLVETFAIAVSEQNEALVPSLLSYFHIRYHGHVQQLPLLPSLREMGVMGGKKILISLDETSKYM